MQIFATIALLLSLAFLIAAYFKKKRLNILENAETVSVSEARNNLLDGEVVELSGEIECENPLVSELTELKCVHYKMSVNYEYEVDRVVENSDGSRTKEREKKTRNLAANERHVAFNIRDSSGSMRVDPELAEFESEKVLSDFEVDNRQHSGSIQIGGLKVNFPSVEVNSINPAFRYTEYAIPTDRKIYILGQVDHSGSEPIIRKPDSNSPLIISLKSKSSLTHTSQKGVKAMTITAAVFLIMALLAFYKASVG